MPAPLRSLLLACAMLLGMGFGQAALAQSPQPFGPCPIEAYQTIQVGGSYGLYTINVGDGTITLVGTDTELQGSNGGNTNGINAIGFNTADRFIYGWNSSTRQIVRVGQSGVAEFLGPTPAGLNGYGPNVGDVFNGRLYLLSGTQMRVVDLATNAVVASLSSSALNQLTDWAFNSADGLLYAVRNNDGAILRIDPVTAAVTVVSTVTVPTGSAFGAQYFDDQGSLYASRNDGTIYRVRNADGRGPLSVQVLTSAAPATGQNDGARCPNSLAPVASVNLAKALTAESGALPGRAEPGELLTYTFTLTNNGSAATVGAYPFHEVLPAGTRLESVSGVSVDCPVASTGARLCTLTYPGTLAASGGAANATLVVRVLDPLPAGITRILNLVADDNATPPAGCTGTNQPCNPAPACDPALDPAHCVVLPLPSADLRLTKTNTPGINGEVDQTADNVTSGTTVAYTVVAANNGPDDADGALLTDPAPAGMSCTTATCTATGGASCPAQTGAALVAALQGGGVAVPSLPAGGSVTVVLSCQIP